MFPNIEINSLSFKMTDNCSKTILTDGGESPDSDEETEEEQPEDGDTPSQTGESEDEESVTDGDGETGQDGEAGQDEQSKETHELTVAVENGEGEPVPHADLTIESDDMGVIEGFLDDAEQQETDSNGEATFELENAEYTVEAVANGEELERTVEIDDEDEQITLTVDTEDSEEEDEEEERGGPKEAEGDVADEETESHGTPRGTTVLYLDLEGLFLDLLGLEVDLHEVVLDIRAIPGGGKLLGNLLSAVAGLLSGGPLSALLSRLLNTISKLLSGLTSPLRSLRSLGSRVWGAITAPIDWLGTAKDRAWNTITSPMSALRSRSAGNRDNEGAESQSEDESWLQSVTDRVPNPLPSGGQLIRTSTDILNELSSESGSGEEADESSSSMIGHQLGEILGRRLGEGIVRILGGSSNSDEGSES